jgi:hypothetical protein
MPAEIVPISSHLREAVKKVEAATGRLVTIEKLGANPELNDNSLAQGFHAREGNTERIWLNNKLSPEAYEATAAHELAHIIQRSSGYPRAVGSSRRYGLLAERVNNLVLDIHSDRWALAEGFNVRAALGESALPQLTTALRGMPVNTETLSSKMDTQALAVDFAALKLRLGKFGLFAGLDRDIANRWPEAWRTGLEIWRVLSRFSFSSAPSCRRAMKKVLQVLGIPEDLIRVE